jgi:hypothetical protein
MGIDIGCLTESIKFNKTQAMNTKQYDETNRLVAFPNKKKADAHASGRDASKYPDYTGKVNVNGKELELAIWIKETSKGKFLSGIVSEPKEGGGKSFVPQVTPIAPKPAKTFVPQPEFDDELPF